MKNDVKAYRQRGVVTVNDGELPEYVLAEFSTLGLGLFAWGLTR